MAFCRLRRRRRRKTHEEVEPHKRALTKEQALGIIKHLPEGRYRLFGLLAFWTGFRPGKLIGLRVRNVFADDDELQVDETVEHGRGGLSQGVPKTKKSRWRKVPVPPDVMTKLTDHIASRGP